MALLIAAAAALSACGDGDEPRAKASPTPSHTPPPSTQVVEGSGELAVGITEPNPNFIRTGEVVGEFARWRDALAKMRPTYYRLSVDWAGTTAPDGTSPDFTKPNPGCMRDIPPCGGYTGVRDQLAAIASAQKASGGDRWQVMVVLAGTPDELAQPAAGCERAGTEPRSRPPTAEGLERYQEFIVQLLDEARAVGVELRWWSPWNEPNHPFFIASQRAECSGKAKSLATEPYAQLARAMRRALEGYPGRQEMVIGETAGLLDRKPTYTDVRGFIRGLPKDVVCSARAYGQHGYIGGPDPVDDVARALRPFDCRRNLEIWMTETGAGRARSGEERDTSRKGQLRNCRAMHRRLKRWYEDPRVTAAFQYTLREDDRFPTGLVTTDLTKEFPALKEWQAWGDREPAAAPPKAHCG